MDSTASATPDHVRQLVAAGMGAASPADPTRRQAVGLESEHLLVHTDAAGRPCGRATLAELTALLDDHPDLDPEPPHPREIRGWRRPDGTRLLPEPGAQLEMAGPPAETGTAALAGIRAVTRDIATLLDARGIALVSAGLDLWHDAAEVSQQLTSPRYPAMHAYFARRSPHGHVMMTHTASLQVNLDLGDPDTARRRWTMAMLATPVITASLAASPVPGALSGRGSVWAWVDPDRTAIPPAFVAGCDDPVEALSRQALAADVMLFNRGQQAHPGEPGFSLADWLANPHPQHGTPTVADVAYHLTTLFPPVRARGYLEIRSVDALPDRWRAVPVVLLCGLLYDERTLDSMLGVMLPHRHRLDEFHSRAIHLGVADGELCAMAVELWSAAVEGAARLGVGFFDAADIIRTEAFIERFTMRGRSPSDELRERLGQGTAAGLNWGREPVGTLRLC